jgi:hypothetical protein
MADEFTSNADHELPVFRRDIVRFHRSYAFQIPFAVFFVVCEYRPKEWHREKPEKPHAQVVISFGKISAEIYAEDELL